MMLLKRADIVAAAFAAGPDVAYSPIRTQVLLFLMDREICKQIGSERFSFRPTAYGPHDPAVFRVLESLARAGDVRIDTSKPWPAYALTASGKRRGAAVLAGLIGNSKKYPPKAARWALLMPIGRMLAAIRRQYPDAALGRCTSARPAAASVRETPFARGMVSAYDLFGSGFRKKWRAKSDAKAIRDAWSTVGAALEDAMADYGRAHRPW